MSHWRQKTPLCGLVLIPALLAISTSATKESQEGNFVLHWLLVPEELLAGGEDSLSASISPSVTHSAPLTITLPCSEARLMCTDKAQPSCATTALRVLSTFFKQTMGSGCLCSHLCQYCKVWAVREGRCLVWRNVWTHFSHFQTMLASTYRAPSLSVWFRLLIDLLFDACWQHLWRWRQKNRMGMNI